MYFPATDEVVIGAVHKVGQAYSFRHLMPSLNCVMRYEITEHARNGNDYLMCRYDFSKFSGLVIYHIMPGFFLMS